MAKFKTCINLFFIMLKIGLFTFGGGYAMITLLENEFVTKRKWLGNDEFLNIVTIAESTPGPIAINSATYVGYKRAGFWGSLAATVAVCIPSFVIIYLISLFFDAFMQLEYVAYAFEGIQVCVIFLILSAGVKMFLKLEKTVFNIITFIAATVCMITLSVLAISFSSVYYVLIAAGLALAVYLIVFFRERRRATKGAGDAPSPVILTEASEGERSGEIPQTKSDCVHADFSTTLEMTEKKEDCAASHDIVSDNPPFDPPFTQGGLDEEEAEGKPPFVIDAIGALRNNRYSVDSLLTTEVEKSRSDSDGQKGAPDFVQGDFSTSHTAYASVEMTSDSEEEKK